jgi:hypothetical protein
MVGALSLYVNLWFHVLKEIAWKTKREKKRSRYIETSSKEMEAKCFTFKRPYHIEDKHL